MSQPSSGRARYVIFQIGTGFIASLKATAVYSKSSTDVTA
jgi:hypothetical protein